MKYRKKSIVDAFKWTEDTELRGDCPFYEIPEWTEKDHNNLALVKDCMVNDDSIMDTLEKLCLLAGVEE